MGDGGITADNGQYLADSALAEKCPELGVYSIEFGTDTYEVERVSARYCTVNDVIQYGKFNGDDFERLEQNLLNGETIEDCIQTKIQAAEETIEDCARRSFCRRKAEVAVRKGFNELPMVDVRSTSLGTLVSDRQLTSDEAGTAEVVYGADPSASLFEAAKMLVASRVRPRVGSENTRGTSMDGVYVSYNLATGEAPNWTGIPGVDAFIQQHRAIRPVIA